MRRFWLLFITTLAVPSLALAQIPPVPLGVTLRLGGGITREGRHPAATVGLDVGPIQGFGDVFFGDGWTQTNVGLHLIPLRLPIPMLKPYVGFGGGFAYATATGTTNRNLMVDGVAGLDIHLPGKSAFFVQARYLYTLGDAPRIRDAIFFGGILFRIGL